MKLLFTILTILFSFPLLNGQNDPIFWKDFEESKIWLSEKSEIDVLPQKYRSLSLDLEALINYLAQAPMEGSSKAKFHPFLLSLPLPDGTLETFEVVESPVMAPGLAARFPMIKSYLGRGTKNRDHTVRFDYGVQGFNAVIQGEQAILITPYATNQTQYYISYNLKDFSFENFDLPPVLRGFDASVYNPDKEREINEFTADEQDFRDGGPKSEFVNLRIYDFALAATGEYSQNHGGTTESVLSSLVLATDVLNSVLERDAAIRVVLVEHNDLIIFLNPDTDFYVNANNGGALLGQNPGVLDQVIGANNYGWGHVFTASCNDVGGVVGGAICSPSKGAGVTCHFSNNVAVITMQIGAHEMAHQLTGGHTFSSCPGSEGQLNLSTAFEPGSGSTLLSYSGSCGDQNIAFNSDPYYNGGNIGQFFQFTRQGTGGTCTTIEVTENHEPELVIPYQNGFYVPKSTPFELNATATDEDGDELTYNWEQINTGTAPLGMPFLESPLFRSWPPTTSSNRVLPRLPVLLNNGFEVVEILPDYSRNITFRCTVRDNYPGAGGVLFKDVSFESTETAGPFRVTHPNADTVVWQAGNFMEVTWDVANTTNELVDCQSVTIKLSTDGGLNYPFTLVANTPNDGTEFVPVPNTESASARVRVEAAQNIFFDISNKNFSVIPASEPGYTFGIPTQYQLICAPNSAQATLTTGSILNFDKPITFDIVEGLPGNVSADFSANPVSPGESSTLSLDLSSVSEDMLIELQVRAVAEGADTSIRTLIFDVVNSDFSALKLLEPADGTSDVGFLLDFNWTGLPNADFYDFELATNPSFDDQFIVERKNATTETSFSPSESFERNTLYFWRVRPSNSSCSGEFSAPFAFHTFTVQCSAFNSSDVPITIPALGTPTLQSELTIVENGTIDDVNVTKIRGFHDAVPDLEIRLVSPEGTSVVLMSKACGNTSLFNLGFDDDAPFEIQCPPIGGTVFLPKEPLSAFGGESILGVWKLVVEILDEIGAGGSLDQWGVEFCASFSPNDPFLLVNETLIVPPGDKRDIRSTSLLADDVDNTPGELVYTIAMPTQFGTVYKENTPLTAGSHFTQQNINSGIIRYENEDPDATEDFFSFTVEDGTGGWFGTPGYNISIHDDAPVATTEIDVDNDILLYPNPAGNSLTISLKKPFDGEVAISVFDLNGRLLSRREVGLAQADLKLKTEGLANGVYFLSFQTEGSVFTKKFVIQK